MSKLIDLARQHFGRWTVLAMHPERRRGNVCWLCRCDCDGTEKVVPSDALRNGSSTSCGCVQREAARKQLVNLTGQRFDYWTVLTLHSERSPGRGALWLCRCRCGTERAVLGASLRNGSSKSCGKCLKRGLARQRIIDLTGKRFGYWTALALHSERDARGRILWLCRCDCGEERPVRGDSLRDGITKSCSSCKRFQREFQRKRHTTHGMSKTRIYGIWEGIKSRCLNPNNPNYSYYGGRWGREGALHQDWHPFEGFYADVGDRPSPELTFDRPDNDRGYAPDNWRWADRATQLANRRPYRPRAKTKTKQRRSPPPSDPEEDVPW